MRTDHWQGNAALRSAHALRTPGNAGRYTGDRTSSESRGRWVHRGPGYLAIGSPVYMFAAIDLESILVLTCLRFLRLCQSQYRFCISDSAFHIVRSRIRTGPLSVGLYPDGHPDDLRNRPNIRAPQQPCKPGRPGPGCRQQHCSVHSAKCTVHGTDSD